MRTILFIALLLFPIHNGFSRASKAQVYNYALRIGIKYPIICASQAIYESANFSSRVYLNKNNCLGFKGNNGRYKQFKSWKDCIAFYKVYQHRSGHSSSYGNWLVYVGRNYSNNKAYYVTLKAIIRDNKNRINN